MQGVCCAPCRSLRTALKDRSVVYAYNEFYRLEMQYFLLFEYFYAFIRNDAERRAQLPTVGRSIPSAAGARVPKKRRARVRFFPQCCVFSDRIGMHRKQSLQTA